MAIRRVTTITFFPLLFDHFPLRPSEGLVLVGKLLGFNFLFERSKNISVRLHPGHETILLGCHESQETLDVPHALDDIDDIHLLGQSLICLLLNWVWLTEAGTQVFQQGKYRMLRSRDMLPRFERLLSI